MAFVHLHTHTEFSPMDGMSKMVPLAQKCAADGNPALAATDHGTLSGIWALRSACHKAGIKPIVGMEAYVAIGSRTSKGEVWIPDAYSESADPTADNGSEDDPATENDGAGGDLSVKPLYAKVSRKRRRHLTVLARNRAGWHNIVRLNNDAALHLSGGKYPTTDYEKLQECSDGLMVLTGCIGGHVAGSLSAYVGVMGVWGIRGNLGRNKGAFPLSPRLLDAVETPDSSALGATPGVSRGDAYNEMFHAVSLALRWYDEAQKGVDELVSAVGRENVYVEVMDHQSPAETSVLPHLFALAEANGLPAVATNDSHFLEECQHDAHEAWLGVQTGDTVSKPDRFVFHGSGHHVRTEAEMRALYPRVVSDGSAEGDMAAWLGDRWQRACDNTVAVAERVESDVIPEPDMRLPVFPLPDGFNDNDTYFKHLITQGVARRYGDNPSEEVWRRVQREYDVISGQGFIDYFLIVHDMIAWARSQGIRVGPGRGSAAGSVVSYCLGIVGLCPIDYGLLFERFLDPSRTDIPDIDVDFEKDRRGEVIEYLRVKYGHDRVVRLGTFNIARTLMALRDAARFMEIARRPGKVVDAMCALVPKKTSLTELEQPGEGAGFQEFIAQNDLHHVFDLAKGFEDVIRGTSVHACGVVLSNEDLGHLVPLRLPADSTVAVTQWDGNDVQEFGLVKLDALGLRTLDIISAAVNFIASNRGVVVDPESMDFLRSDPEKWQKTFDLIARGKTGSVFQLESAGMKKLAVQANPTTVEDVIALLALYRPGPMGTGMHTTWAERASGRAPVNYGIFSDVPAEQELIASVLEETRGTIAYQEQLMRLAKLVGNFDDKHTNMLRKAISKKKQDDLDALRQGFLEGAVLPGEYPDGTPAPPVSVQCAEFLWKTFEASGEYLFNKSHAAAYGLLALQTAWLKANYPVELAAAVLVFTPYNKDKAYKRAEVLSSLHEENITVLGPHINESQMRTAPVGDVVRIGLVEVKSAGKTIELLLNERDENGPFTSLRDVCRRAGAVGVGFSQLAPLIGAGALDIFGPRLGMLTVARALYGCDVPVPNVEWGIMEKARRERMGLGFIASHHPLEVLAPDIEKYLSGLGIVTVRLADIEAENREIAEQNSLSGGSGQGESSRPVTTVGMVSEAEHKTFQRKDGSGTGQFGKFIIEDEFGNSIEATVWGREYESMRERGEFPQVEDIVCVRGTVESFSMMRERKMLDEVTGEEEIVVESVTRYSLKVRRVIAVPAPPTQPQGAWDAPVGMEVVGKLRDHAAPVAAPVVAPPVAHGVERRQYIGAISTVVGGRLSAATLGSGLDSSMAQNYVFGSWAPREIGTFIVALPSRTCVVVSVGGSLDVALGVPVELAETISVGCVDGAWVRVD